MTITQKIGDTVTHRIAMRWNGRPFVAGDSWNLVFTIKADPNDSDDDALVQKAYGAGITASEDDAFVSLIHEDTAGGVINEGEEDETTLAAIAPGKYYWDIQAQRLAEPHDVRTVAGGQFVLLRDITRRTTNTLPIFTTSPAAPIQVPVAGKSAYEIAVENGYSGTEEEWLASLQGQDGEGNNNTTISNTPPANPQPGDTWIDTNGWIESYWHAQEDAGEAGGYWISTQPRPSNVGFLVYGTYSLIWTPAEDGIPYYLIWTPTT